MFNQLKEKLTARPSDDDTDAEYGQRIVGGPGGHDFINTRPTMMGAPASAGSDTSSGSFDAGAMPSSSDQAFPSAASTAAIMGVPSEGIISPPMGYPGERPVDLNQQESLLDKAKHTMDDWKQSAHDSIERMKHKIAKD
jgi:hypothetical protein